MSLRYGEICVNKNLDYTVSQKNVPSMACYNFDIHEQILIFFGRNVTNKVGNQRVLSYASSNNWCFCTTWQNEERRKSHFSLNCCISWECCSSWTVLHQCAVFLKEKLSSVMCLIACTFVEIVRYPINTVCPLTFTQAWWRTTPIFYTTTDTATDLVNIEHLGNRQQDPRSCLVHPFDRFDSEGWFSCNQAIF